MIKSDTLSPPNKLWTYRELIITSFCAAGSAVMISGHLAGFSNAFFNQLLNETTSHITETNCSFTFNALCVDNTTTPFKSLVNANCELPFQTALNSTLGFNINNLESIESAFCFFLIFQFCAFLLHVSKDAAPCASYFFRGAKITLTILVCCFPFILGPELLKHPAALNETCITVCDWMSSNASYHTSPACSPENVPELSPYFSFGCEKMSATSVTLSALSLQLFSLLIASFTVAGLVKNGARLWQRTKQCSSRLFSRRGRNNAQLPTNILLGSINGEHPNYGGV